MTKTRGTALLMVWTDIDPEFEAEFNRWYDEEHIPLLLQIPVSSPPELFGGEGWSEISRDLRARRPQRIAHRRLRGANPQIGPRANVFQARAG